MALHNHIKAEKERLNELEKKSVAAAEKRARLRDRAIGIAFEKSARDHEKLAPALVGEKQYAVKFDGVRRIKGLKDIFGRARDFYCGAPMGIQKEDIEAHPAYRAFQQKLANEGYEVREIKMHSVTGAYNLAYLTFGKSSLFPSLWK